VRIAIISTPRSGNTWLRHILSTGYDLIGIMAHSPIDVDWAHLPEHCVLQIHWHRTDSFVDRLEHYGFRVIALARHPFDVLISILQFSLYNSTARWLEGEAGNEAGILGAMPRSNAFLRYCKGPRATALLNLTGEWWSSPGCIRARYEDLVDDAPAAVTRLAETLGRALKWPLDKVIEKTSLHTLRQHTRGDHHFWLGKVGIWRCLLTATEADLLQQEHGDLCAGLGYSCTAESGLSAEEADDYWIRLAWTSLADRIQNARIQQDIVFKLEEMLTAQQKQNQQIRERLQTLEKAAEEARAAYDPEDLQLARRLHELAARYPRLSQQARQAARLGRWLRFPRISRVHS
jgi:hypothetical protein